MNKSIIQVSMLCVMLVLFFNCKKQNTDPIPPTFNYSTFTDARDGKVYKYIKIGSQQWMAENLAYKTESGSWISGDNEEVDSRFGFLYTWEAANQAPPAGWHLPSDAEWKLLEKTLGMSQNEADGVYFRGTNEGTKLKSTIDWSGDENGTNSVGFTALAGGFRSNSGTFFVFKWLGYWWSATESDNSSAWFRSLSYNHSNIFRNISYKEDAYAVRCVKDK